jgi:hypothetical protein
MKIYRPYKREHLRAGYQEEIITYSDDLSYLVSSYNISEGGMLIGDFPFFPQEENLWMILKIPRLPHLKNFTLYDLKNSGLPSPEFDIIKVFGRLIRHEQNQKLSEVLSSRYGFQFLNLSSNTKNIIKNYVDSFASNLIYIRILFDEINSSKIQLEKCRLLLSYMGFKNLKISQVKKIIDYQYDNLQW